MRYAVALESVPQLGVEEITDFGARNLVGVSDMHRGDFILNLRLIPVLVACQIGITGILCRAILNPARVRVRETAERT